MTTSPRPTTPVDELDTAALTDPVVAADARRFDAELARARGTSASDVVAYILGAGIVVFLAIVFGMLLAWLTRRPGGFITAALVALSVAALVALVVARMRRGVTAGRTRRYRLSRFAAANGFVYRDRVPAPDLPGMIFQVGGSRLSTDVVTRTHPAHVEYGHHQFTTRNGKHTLTHHWGYVAIKLDVPLPHIVLDGVKSNTVLGSNLPAPVKASQRLSLEGDFDRYFELYCPAGYERDALYLFAPDIMARFVDDAAQFDVEIVDDWLFLFTQRAVTTLDPATWRWLFDTTAALRDKVAQWRGWRDDHGAEAPEPTSTTGALPFPGGRPAGVAEAGKRLEKGRGPAWIAAVAVGMGLVAVVAEILGDS